MRHGAALLLEHPTDDWIWRLNSAKGKTTLVLLSCTCQISRCLSTLDGGGSGWWAVSSTSLHLPLG